MLTKNTSNNAFKLISFLSEALPAIDYRVPTDINNGGCGQFAEILYKALVDIGEQPTLHAIYKKKDSGEGEANLREYLSNGNNLSKAGEDHIIVGLHGIFLDSTGIVTTAYLASESTYQLRIEQLEALNQSGDWSFIFDRGCIPLIKKLVANAFATFKNGTWVAGEMIKTLPKNVTYSNYSQKARKRASRSSGLNYLMGGL